MKNTSLISKEKGFAMLFAVLVSSVLLSIGVSIFNLTLKELTLSSSGRESQFAFYAADTGMECAIYWDFKSATPGVMFATSSAESFTGWRDSLIDAENPTCATTAIGDSLKTLNVSLIPSPAPDYVKTQFVVSIPSTPINYCAIVTVTKDSTAGPVATIIESRGYNAPCSGLTDQNTIERGLRVTY